eukprot:CAMPEP_0179351448 /NCGR_PEP_ID=MMETSP0797-20121207/75283_1 /TAXON_ID=47934 /ORGANISM="Dinophysis acuminata, Strain DAEP01" /LENGTH=131 /DNA_ID=CAMNT_0021066405 /DNA_START=194 /DNA_END=589 /DNA_ORIENTATION=-
MNCEEGRGIVATGGLCIPGRSAQVTEFAVRGRAGRALPADDSTDESPCQCRPRHATAKNPMIAQCHSVLKLWPQPHSDFLFGLLKMNSVPSSLLTKSISVPIKNITAFESTINFTPLSTSITSSNLLTLSV